MKIIRGIVILVACGLSGCESRPIVTAQVQTYPTGQGVLKALMEYDDDGAPNCRAKDWPPTKECRIVALAIVRVMDRHHADLAPIYGGH